MAMMTTMRERTCHSRTSLPMHSMYSSTRLAGKWRRSSRRTRSGSDSWTACAAKPKPVDQQRQRDLERQRFGGRKRPAGTAGGTATPPGRCAATAGGGKRWRCARDQWHRRSGCCCQQHDDHPAAGREGARRSPARQRLATERERAAAAERERVMRPFVEASNRQQALSPSSAGTAAVSSTPKAAAASVDHGSAKAWCRARRNEMARQTEYQCMGPLQNLLFWYPTLDAPLGMAGCPGGEG